MPHQKSLNKLLDNSKIVVSLLVLSFIISSVGVFPVLGDTGHTWSITVDEINGKPSPFTILSNPIHINGTISSTNFVGDISQYQVQINWGDGTVDQDSNIQINQVGSDFIGTWSTSPDHNYTTNGEYTTTVKLYHSQPPGAEASGDATYTVTYSVIVGVNVNTSPTGLKVIVDDKTYTAPFQTDWIVGSQHTLSTIEIQQDVIGTRYIWNGWSDGDGITHQVIIQNKDCVYTANFNTQHYLTVTSDPSSVPLSFGTGWYVESSTIILEALEVDGLLFSYWDIDGISQGIAVNPVSVQMDIPHIACAHYVNDSQPTPSPNPTSTPIPTYSPSPTLDPTPVPTVTPTSPPEPTATPAPTSSPNPSSTPTPATTGTIRTAETRQVSITFDQSGIESDYDSTVLIVDGTSYKRNDLPFTIQWIQGTTHTFAFNSPLTTSSNRYDWANTTGLTSLQSGTLTPTSSGTIKANYSQMCYLTVNAIGVSDPFTASVQIVASPLTVHIITPTIPVEQWITQNHQITAAISTANIIGHGEWAIFKGWTGRVEKDTQEVSFSMSTPATLNAVFFKVNPVAESVAYSLTAGIASMIVLSLINRRKPAQKNKNVRVLCTAAGITMVSLIVAIAVSMFAAVGYGIDVGKLLDFTNWAVIFTSVEAMALMATSILIIRKIHYKHAV
jgi:hypothetical protein